MTPGRLFGAAILVVAATANVIVQQPAPAPRTEKADTFSPLGFDDLRAYEQAFPGLPGSGAGLLGTSLAWGQHAPLP